MNKQNYTIVITAIITAFIVGAGSYWWQTDQEALNNYSLSGTVVAGRFVGTEKACEFNNEAAIGDRMGCNSGSVFLYLVNDEGTPVWLDGYECGANEYFVKESAGRHRIEYETFICTNNIIVGQPYTFTGTPETRPDQWHMGKKQDEIWLLDVQIK